MGGVLAKIYFKTDYEEVQLPSESLWKIRQYDIDRESVEMGLLINENTKCVMFVNVATKWGIAQENYQILNEVYD